MTAQRRHRAARSPSLADPDSTTGWMALGLCRMYPPATFFPSDGVGVDKARKICAALPGQGANASSTRSSTASNTACGAAAASVNAGGS